MLRKKPSISDDEDDLQPVELAGDTSHTYSSSSSKTGGLHHRNVNISSNNAKKNAATVKSSSPNSVETESPRSSSPVSTNSDESSDDEEYKKLIYSPPSTSSSKGKPIKKQPSSTSTKGKSKVVDDDEESDSSDLDELTIIEYEKKDEVIVPKEVLAKMTRSEMLSQTLDELCVSSFVSIGNPFSHWVYRVESKFTTTEAKINCFIVYHRFSDFQKFYNELVSFPELKALVPYPPSKIGPRYTDPKIIQDRCNQLNEFLNKVIRVKLVQQKEACREVLYRFLTHGEDADNITAGTQAEPLGIGTWAAQWFSYYGTKMLTQQKDFTPQEDYSRLCAKLQHWGVPPRTFPWKKYVITIYGTTSAGKSSLVNHLFTLSVARSGGTQIDTGYTIFETLPSTEFAQVVDSRSKKKSATFTEEQLLAPLPESWEKIYTDPRYGKVFVINQDLERFRQQFNDKFDYVKSHNKARSVFINEDYLRGDPNDIELAKNLIVIDSKGLDQTAKELLAITNAAELEQKKLDIQLMQLLNQLSDKILFLFPYNDRHNCTEQIATFELSIVCSFDNGSLMEEKIEEVRKLQAEKEEKELAQRGYQYSSALGLGANLLGYVMQPVMGLSVDVISNLRTKIVNSVMGNTDSKRKHRAAMLGNELWEKTRFMITKIDEFWRYVEQQDSTDHSAELQLYYDLGRAFGNRKYIEAPTLDKFIPIGLPEKNLRNKSKNQKPIQDLHRELLRDKKMTGNLLSFKESLLKESTVSSYDKRLDEAILSMCDQLDALIKENEGLAAKAGKWWDDYSDARARAKSRMMSYV
eukprot:TRINITY_DN10652_c0_g1_i1.p1 TRINITY_DN10652_c0_g1~~TRINITY_DN10652_c0_g1_i1.p1  ORF type:complete len:806 (-),score=169.71 TRINITY_DN10652_c0_g1_i1:127-2544(-)